jgi:hypothetical protein
MALMNCPQHGRQGIAHVCPHLKDSFGNHETCEKIHLRDELGTVLDLCPACAQAMQAMDRTKVEDEFLPNLTFICAKCLMEWT